MNFVSIHQADVVGSFVKYEWRRGRKGSETCEADVEICGNTLVFIFLKLNAEISFKIVSKLSETRFLRSPNLLRTLMKILRL